MYERLRALSPVLLLLLCLTMETDASAAAPFAYLVRLVEYNRTGFPTTLLPVAPNCTVLVSGSFLDLPLACPWFQTSSIPPLLSYSHSSLTTQLHSRCQSHCVGQPAHCPQDPRLFLFLTFSFPLGTTRTRQDLTGTLTVRRRTAAGGVWELAVGTDSTVELAAGDVLEVADGTTLRAMLVCPGRFPDTAAEPMDLSAVEKLAVCCSLARAFVFVKLLCFHRRQKS